MVENKEVLGARAELYVKNMAIELGINEDSERLAAIYKGAAKWVPAQVNKKMLVLAKSESKKKEIVPFEMIQKIDKLGHFKKEKMIRELESAINHGIDNYNSYVNEMNGALKNIADSTRRKKMLEDQEDTNSLGKQVIEILENPFYQFLKLEGDTIIFKTSDVIMRWSKKAAKLKYELNLGRYQVIVKPSNGSVNIMALENNTILEKTYIHPHIKTSGVCWGNASDALKRIATEGDIRPAMTAIEALLQTYNDQSPYRSIERFAQAQEDAIFLKGKKGDIVARFEDMRELGILYFDLKNIDLLYADLKYPIKYAQDQQRLAAPYFVRRSDGLPMFQLKDESWINIDKLTRGAHSGAETRSISYSTLDEEVAAMRSRSAIYKEKYSDMNFDEIRALEASDQTIYYNGTRSGLTLTDIRKAITNVVR